MRIPRRSPGIIFALTVCGVTLLPLAAQAGGYNGPTASTVAEDAPALRFQNGPCGLRSLRSHGVKGSDANLVGVWNCAKQVLLPARFRDAETESSNPTFTKKNDLNWGVRVRHHQLFVSVGLKW